MQVLEEGALAITESLLAATYCGLKRNRWQTKCRSDHERCDAQQKDFSNSTIARSGKSPNSTKMEQYNGFKKCFLKPYLTNILTDAKNKIVFTRPKERGMVSASGKASA